jgi:hypothetical protein
MIAQVGYSVVGLSRGRVTPCAVRTMHMKMRSTCFLVEPNQARRFVSGLASKPLGWFLSGLASKQLGRWFGLKITRTVCQWFGLKTTGTISFGLASKPVVEGFPVWTSKLTATVS